MKLLDSHHKNKIMEKMHSILKLTRSVNLLPTLLLTFSGGFITNPSLNKILFSYPFICTNIITLLIMSFGMVINDIFDIEIDKLNNPSRPLITGKISINEAYVLCFSIVLFISILDYTLPNNLQLFTNIMLYGITIYTPVLKKIPLIKNVYCASTISFAMLYSGLSTNQELYQTIYYNKHFNILLITMRYVFFGSLKNELLLDICDIEGDKKNNIITIPILIGKSNSWLLINGLLYSNLIFLTFSLNSIYNNIYIKIIPLSSFIPMIIDIYKIKKSNYEKSIIDKTLKNAMGPMFIILLYMCVLSYNIKI
uniref:UbiA prenyltransferase family protein n=1 Tax=viral metagenome TaxID=1070528 RepID=A0A6C0EEN4_9ZZZZ